MPQRLSFCLFCVSLYLFPKQDTLNALEECFLLMMCPNLKNFCAHKVTTVKLPAEFHAFLTLFRFYFYICKKKKTQKLKNSSGTQLRSTWTPSQWQLRCCLLYFISGPTKRRREAGIQEAAVANHKKSRVKGHPQKRRCRTFKCVFIDPPRRSYLSTRSLWQRCHPRTGPERFALTTCGMTSVGADACNVL